MKATEFILEYMNYTPVHNEPDHPYKPMISATDRINFLLTKGEARDSEHALRIAAGELACELEMDPVEVKNRLKKELKGT